MSFRRVVLLAAAAALFAAPNSSDAQSLDFGVYQSTVEPIFLTKRDGFTRCVVCHGGATNSFSLIRLRPGVNAYTEEQSRKNFEVVSKLVVPGKPEDSHLLMYPLVPEEGGGGLSLGRPAMAEQERSELAGHRQVDQRAEIADIAQPQKEERADRPPSPVQLVLQASLVALVDGERADPLGRLAHADDGDLLHFLRIDRRHRIMRGVGDVDLPAVGRERHPVRHRRHRCAARHLDLRQRHLPDHLQVGQRIRRPPHWRGCS